MSITVVIADDQAMVRQGFGALLAAQDDIEVIGDAADGRAAVELVRAVSPDVVLMDVRMPVLDGLRATRELLTGSDRVASKILMLTTFDIDDYVYDALAAGASGFMLKDAPAAELVRAVRVVAAGDALLAPSVTQRLISEVVSTRRPRPAAPGATATLTPREREVLEKMAEGKSNAEIASVLFVTEQTVKTHVSSVLAKLGLRDRVQAVVYAFENGLR